MSFADGTVESYTVGRTAVQSIPEMLAQRLGPSQIGHIVIIENPVGTYTGYKLTGLPASDLANWSLLGSGGSGSLDWGDITNKPTDFPPGLHNHPWEQVTARPTLVDALAALTGDGLLRKTGSALTLIGSTAVGMSLLTATDQSAGRAALGLGAAATLGIDTDGGVPTINAGKLSPSVIPNIMFGATPFPVADQAARLALGAAVIGSIAIQASPASNWVLQALPASTAGNWLQFSVPVGTVASVFGLTGAVSMTDLTSLNGAAALNDLVAGYDTSVGAHRSITLQKIIDLVVVPVASSTPPPNIGTATAGTTGQWADAGHSHAIVNIPGVSESCTARTDVSSVGNIALGATSAIPSANIYWARLTGAAVTINLPALVPAAGTAVGFTTWIDQDATGGRMLTFSPPAGYSIEWDGGAFSAPLSGANKMTEYVFRIGHGSTVFRASKVYQNG